MEESTKYQTTQTPVSPINRLKHFSVAPSPAPDTQAIRFVIAYNEFIMSAATLFYEQVVTKRCIIENNVNADLVNKEMQSTPEGQSVCSAQLLTLDKIIRFFNNSLDFDPVYDVKYESDTFDITMIYPDCDCVVSKKKSDKGALTIIPKTQRDVILSVLDTIRNNADEWDKCTDITDTEILAKWQEYKEAGRMSEENAFAGKKLKMPKPLTVDSVSGDDLRAFGKLVSGAYDVTHHIGSFFLDHNIKGAPGNLVGKFMAMSGGGYMYMIDFDLSNELACQEVVRATCVHDAVAKRVEKFLKTELAKCTLFDSVVTRATNGRIHVSLRFRVSPTMTTVQIWSELDSAFSKIVEHSGSKVKQWHSALNG